MATKKHFRPMLTEDAILLIIDALTHRNDPLAIKTRNYLTQFKLKIATGFVGHRTVEDRVSVTESLGFTSSSTDLQTLTGEQKHAALVQTIEALPVEVRSDSDWFELLALKDARTDEEQQKYEEVSQRLYGMIL